MTLEELLEKRDNGLELTIDERFRILDAEVFWLRFRIEDLEKKKINYKKPPIYKVLNVYFTNTYEYKGRTFYRYMVHLEGHEDLYIMDKLDTTTDVLEPNNLIYCKIDGDKLKEVKILYEPK